MSLTITPRAVLCALSSLVLPTVALQHTTTEQWNPFDTVFSQSDAPEASKSDLQEVPADANDALESVAKEPVDEVEEKDYDLLAPSPDSTPPLMLITQGCDGAGSVLGHAHAILKQEGIQSDLVLAENYSEDPKESQVRTMMVKHRTLKKENRTLLFKATIGKDDKTISSRNLFELGTKVVEVSRANMIDQLVCMVKDCLGEGLGHAMVKGKETSACEQRKDVRPKDYKALLATGSLVTNINKLHEDVLIATKEMNTLGYTVERFKSEDLLDFEWDAAKVETAQTAWKGIFKAWGIDVNEAGVSKYLKEQAGKRDIPPPHSETIFNFGAVQSQLKGNKELSGMLRE